jgi:hypothetical protein
MMFFKNFQRSRVLEAAVYASYVEANKEQTKNHLLHVNYDKTSSMKKMSVEYQYSSIFCWWLCDRRKVSESVWTNVGLDRSWHTICIINRSRCLCIQSNLRVLQRKEIKDSRLLIYRPQSCILPQWSGIHVLQMLEKPLLSFLPFNALPRSGVVQQWLQLHHNFRVFEWETIYLKSVSRRSKDIFMLSLVKNLIRATEIPFAF